MKEGSDEKKKLGEMNLLDDFLFGSVVTYPEIGEQFVRILLEYEDGASTLFLYTRGTKGVPNEALKQLLHYMEHTVRENAVNDDLREMHRMVEIVKKDPEMSIRYWKFLEELNRSKKEGDLQRLISQICKKMKKEKPLEEIAEDLEEEVSVIEPIYNAAKDFAPEYDPKAVFERLNTSE